MHGGIYSKQESPFSNRTIHNSLVHNAVQERIFKFSVWTIVLRWMMAAVHMIVCSTGSTEAVPDGACPPVPL